MLGSAVALLTMLLEEWPNRLQAGSHKRLVSLRVHFNRNDGVNRQQRANGPDYEIS